MTTRKLFTITIYTLLMLLIGRNLSFLPKVPTLQKQSKAVELTALKKDITSLLDKERGVYSMLYHDLDSDASFGIQEHQIFTGASVNKIHIITALYQLAGKHALNLDEHITIQEGDIQDYGTGSIRYQEGGTTYSLRTLARLVLNESDNTAAHVIANKIGMARIQNSMERLGLTQTTMEDNKTSLTDLYLLFSKLYRGEVTSPSLTQELLGFMTNTTTEDRLSVLLPTAATIYHKTGDALGNLHDVGIVKANNKAYFIGVMTADVGDHEPHTKENIARISKKVYDVVMNE